MCDFGCFWLLLVSILDLALSPLAVVAVVADPAGDVPMIHFDANRASQFGSLEKESAASAGQNPAMTDFAVSRYSSRSGN